MVPSSENFLGGIRPWRKVGNITCCTVHFHVLGAKLFPVESLLGLYDNTASSESSKGFMSIELLPHANKELQMSAID